MLNFWNAEYKKKVILPSDVKSFAENLKAEGITIATLNGSFDLMHAGHLHIIYEASKQADVLIVALNSDSSVRQYKDPKRPIIPLEYRLQMMSALSFVSYVTWFDETTPCRLLKEICPNVHVNGSDYGSYPIETDVVLSCGGRLHIVDLVPGLSTSLIVERIKSL